MAIRRFTATIVAFLASSATVAFGAQGTAVKGDLARLQGKWAALTVLPNGAKLKTLLEFQGDHVLGIQGDDPKPSSDYRVVLDQTAKPKTIDLVDGKVINQEPGSLLQKIKPPDLFGIYELDGDTLKVAAKPFDKKRPTSFVKAREVSLTIYTRGTVPKEMNIVDAPKTAKGMKPPKLFGDLAALQGTWTTGDGVFHAHGKETMTVQGDSLLVVAKGARGVELRFQSRIKLDESANPKAIDFLGVKVGTKKQPDAFGIYALEGDTLTLHKSGRGRPRSTAFETGSEAGRVATWTRGTVVVEGRPTMNTPAGGSVARVEVEANGQEFQGATVVSFSPRNVVLRTADGRQVQATVIGAKGFDIDGNPAGRGDALLKPGSVINVTVEPIPTSKIGLQKIKTFHLIQAGPGTPGPAR